MDENRVRVTVVAKHVWVVALFGEHDLSTADEVAAAIGRVFDAGSNLVLDLSGASFIDLSVVKAVLQAQEQADRHYLDELRVVAPIGSQPRRALELVAVREVVRLCETRAAAIDMLAYGRREALVDYLDALTEAAKLLRLEQPQRALGRRHGRMVATIGDGRCVQIASKMLLRYTFWTHVGQSPRPADLAQRGGFGLLWSRMVEPPCFHGKEGVNGSSPLECFAGFGTGLAESEAGQDASLGRLRPRKNGRLSPGA
jgi:anti-anti-sigma regulatory factor